MGATQMQETHHACRAQMGSISVTHTMAPRAFRAVQQPFPTYTAQVSQKGYQGYHLPKVYFQE